MPRTGLLMAVVGLLCSAAAAAQAPGGETVETDPIRCWWRSSAGAVRVGEPFSVVLTCAVLAADAVQVVPDESRLSDAVIQMAPFEVVGGSHPADLHAGQRRFFQYEYTLRAIGPDLIGQDVPLPNLSIPYRVNSRLSGNSALQGRDLSYLLPPHVVRVVSTVPADAADIRDTPDVRFDRVESLLFRAGVLDIVGVTLIGLGGLMAIVSLVALARRTRPAAAVEEHGVGERAVLAAAGRELSAVRSEVGHQGWTEPLVARALAATRLAAASALGRRITQQPSAVAAESGEGKIVLRRMNRRRAGVALSSAATAENVARELARMPLDALPARRVTLERLRTALAAFDAVQYGRNAAIDPAALDAGLAEATEATRSLRARRAWPRDELRKWWARAPQPERT